MAFTPRGRQSGKTGDIAKPAAWPRSGLVGGSPWRKRPAYSSQLSPRSTARRGSQKCRSERRSPLANNAPSAACATRNLKLHGACEAAACVKGRHVGAQRPYFCTLPSERCTPPSHLSPVVESLPALDPVQRRQQSNGTSTPIIRPQHTDGAPTITDRDAHQPETTRLHTCVLEPLR